MNGVSTLEEGVFYGHRTDHAGNWSGYGDPWPYPGAWTKTVRVGGRTATARFTVTDGAGVVVDRGIYRAGLRPVYTVAGTPNSPICWSSTRNGVPTLEVMSCYGETTDDTGRWSGPGRPWQNGQAGVWTKTVHVAGQTATATLSVTRVPSDPRDPDPR